MAKSPNSVDATGDGCIKITNTTGLLAKKLGGSLWRNEGGSYVLKGMGADEIAFPDEAHALEHMKRALRASRINAEAHSKIKEIVGKNGDFEIPNYEGLIKLSNKLSWAADAAPGGEQTPPLARSLPDHPGRRISANLMTGNSFLASMGDAGRWSMNAMKRFNTFSEQLELQGYNQIRPAIEQLDQWTTMKELKQRTAPAEAQELWDKGVKPYLDSVQGMRDFLGIEEDLVPSDGIPTHMGVKGDHIPDDLLTAARKQGFIGDQATKDDLAHMLNSPDFGGKRPGESPKDFKARMAWMKRKASGLGGSLNHIYEGGEDYMNSVKDTMMSFNRQASRRLIDAATFGPNGERIEQAAERIENDPKLGSNMRAAYSRAMKEYRGKVHVPRSEFERKASEVMRWHLSGSGTRHLSQIRIPIMQHGFTGAAKGLAKQLFDLPNLGADIKEMSALGVTTSHARNYMDEHPGDLFMDANPDHIKSAAQWAKKHLVDNFTGVVSRASTMGIHVVVNSNRILAGIMAKNNFDNYFEKALAGDRNKLGLFADILGFGDSTSDKGRQAFGDELKNLDRGQVRNYFIKRMADITGTTFHPSDMPVLANAKIDATGFNIGRWLTMFKSFQWNLAHNIWNQMTSPNYSLEHRMLVFGRYIGTTPISAIDPIIRHAKIAGVAGLAASTLGFGLANVNSKLAYDSWHKALKDPSVSDLAYAQLMLTVNDGSLGIAGGFVQGINLHNLDILKDSVSVGGGIPGLDFLGSAAIGAASTLDGIANEDEDETNHGLAEMLADAPFGLQLKDMTRQDEPRVPKKQLLKRLVGADNDDD